MSGNDWTPGPWFISQDVAQKSGEYEQWSIGLAPGGWGIRKDRSDPDEYMLVGGICSQATARLISAAPDLVEAVLVALETEEQRRDTGNTYVVSNIEAFRAALAKARGQ